MLDFDYRMMFVWSGRGVFAWATGASSGGLFVESAAVNVGSHPPIRGRPADHRGLPVEVWFVEHQPKGQPHEHYNAFSSGFGGVVYREPIAGECQGCSSLQRPSDCSVASPASRGVRVVVHAPVADGIGESLCDTQVSEKKKKTRH